MKNFLTDFKTGFGQAQSLYRIFIINIVVFIIVRMVLLLIFFSGSSFDANELFNYFRLPSSFDQFIKQPWSLITYMFFHVSFLHILFNLMVLYWTGRIFAEYLGNEKLWATYILGGITGGILYMLSYNIFPVFSMVLNNSTLNGASAGVLAILVAIATLLPDYTVHLLLIGAVRLKYLALFLVLLYVINIPESNAGGNISHLGGAIFGFIFIRQLKKGNDFTLWLVKLYGKFSRKPVRKVYSKRKKADDQDFLERKKQNQEVIDRILDKISQSGYDSLTAEEKDILFNASKNIKE